MSANLKIISDLRNFIALSSQESELKNLFTTSPKEGVVQPKSVQLGQDDFIPWKRGISL